MRIFRPRRPWPKSAAQLTHAQKIIERNKPFCFVINIIHLARLNNTRPSLNRTWELEAVYIDVLVVVRKIYIYAKTKVKRPLKTSFFLRPDGSYE